MKAFASGAEEARPMLAGDPTVEYDKNVVYGNYLFDSADPDSDPTLMDRLLQALAFKADDNGVDDVPPKDAAFEASAEQPFDVVLATAHRSYGNVGNTQALMQLITALSNMEELAKTVADPAYKGSFNS